MNLITKEDIAKYREISKAVRDEKINPFIQDAEMLDFRNMLGHDLYSDLKENISESNYELLWKGGNYMYNGKENNFIGLEIVLCLLAYARYMMFGSNTDTGFGMVQKSFQDSTPVPAITKKTMYTENRRAASAYFADAVTFLNRNRSDYPLWKKGGCGGIRPSFRISKIN